jgi:AcrR family transcriptional regulator
MARILKLDEYTARRNDILDAALGLVMTKGYERMTVGDILVLMGMSSGAFYHYFDTKTAVLEALIVRIREGSEPPLLAVVDDPGLPAIDKLQTFFDVIETLRGERRAEVIELLQVWHSDDNAVVRAKVEAATFAWRAGLVARIARQGVAEGVFTVARPDTTGEIVMALLQGMGNAHAALMLAFGRGETGEEAFTTALMDLHAAYLDAIERVLGAPSDSLRRADAAAVGVWAKLLRKARI